MPTVLPATMPRDRRDGTIHVLWDELARFPMADAEVACRYLMQTLAAWLKAAKGRAGLMAIWLSRW